MYNGIIREITKALFKCDGVMADQDWVTFTAHLNGYFSCVSQRLKPCKEGLSEQVGYRGCDW